MSKKGDENKFSDYQLNVTKVKDDGRCGYRSIAKHLFTNRYLSLDAIDNQELVTLLFKDDERSILEEKTEVKLADLLKNIALNHIKTHQDKIDVGTLAAALPEEFTHAHQSINFAAFITYHKKEQSYADQVTLRALSQVLKINICTISVDHKLITNETSLVESEVICKNSDNLEATVYLIFDKNAKHYELLTPTAQSLAAKKFQKLKMKSKKQRWMITILV
jgi:hypothetical protein